MTLRKTFLWFGGSFLLLLIVVAGWLWTADLGVFKPQLEQWVSDRTGRQFSIDGEFEVHIGEQTVVIAKGVRYANTAWANEPFLLEVGFFELQIDTWSLFRGPVQIELIKLADTNVYLQRSDTEGANWEMPPRQADASEPDSSDDAGRGFRVRQLDVARTNIVYMSPERLGPIELRIEQLNQQHDVDDFLNLRLQGGVGDREISLHAKVGAWDALLARKAVQYEVAAQLDTFHFESQGFIDDLTRPSRPSLSINASGPDVNDLARLLRIEPEYDGDIDFSGSLSAQDNEPLRLAVEGRLGKTQVRATGAFSNLQSLEQADLELAVSGPDLSRVARLFGVRRLQPAPFALELDATRDGSDLVINKGHMVFAEAEFDLAAHLPKFPELDDASFHFEIVGARYERFREVMGIPGAAKGPYSLALDLRQSPDGIEVMQFDLESTLARGRAEGKLGVAPDYFGTDLTFELDIDSLANIGDAYSMAGVPDRPLKIKGTAVLGSDGIRTRGPISIRSSDIMAEIDGLIGLAPGIAGSDLTVSLNGPSLGELVNLFASTEAVPLLPYSLQGAVQIGSDSYRLQKINAKVGRSSMDVDGSVRLGRGLAGMQLNIKSTGPAFEELIAGSAGPALRPGPYTLSGKVALTQDAVRLEGIDFERESGRLRGDLEIALPLSKRQASFRIRGDGNDLRAVLGTVYDFEMRQAPFSIDLEGDILSTWLSLDKLNLRIGDAEVTANGTLDIGAAQRSTRFSLGINIPDVAELGLLKGRRLRGQSFSLDAKVKGGGGLLTIDELAAKLGDSDIQGSGQLQAGATPQLTLVISSDSIRLAPLMEEVEPQYEPVPTFDDGRMIPDIAMPFERMTSLNAVVKIDIGELQRDNARITNFKLDSQLQDGAFYLRQF
ncbi:MAG: AsmA family protein, partial [Gammaproteobacteria bacterium]|nr:AsmA family protein [Gammaproteobacteria bacterium]